jgi:hypothetical protein
MPLLVPFLLPPPYFVLFSGSNTTVSAKPDPVAFIGVLSSSSNGPPEKLAFKSGGRNGGAGAVVHDKDVGPAYGKDLQVLDCSLLSLAPTPYGQQRAAFSCFTPGNDYAPVSSAHACVQGGLFFEAEEIEVWELSRGCHTLESN